MTMGTLSAIDGVLGSSLVPTIMAISAGRVYADDTLDLLYLTTTYGAILSTVVSSMNFQFRQISRSRNQLTILTTFLLTASLVASIAGFHLIRHNFSPSRNYKLPNVIKVRRVTSGSDVFRHHFYADFIPGIIIATQTILCSMINHDLLYRAKRKFSYGESSIVSQLASTAYLVWALSLYSKLSGAGPFKIDQTTDIILSIGVIFFTVVLLPNYLFIQKPNTLIRYSLLILALSISFMVTRNIIISPEISDPLTWFVDYIFTTHQRISLFSLWLAILAGVISFSTSWSRLVGRTNSYARKLFHAAVSAVFISGYNQDIDFTSFAAGGMIVVISILEIVRSWNLWPFGNYLESTCQALRGHWDNRYLTLSHIYLLVGVMLPLWILPRDLGSNKLLLSSGLISVGVGDAAAAIVGSYMGKTKFIGLKTNKTLEGLVGNITMMAAFKLIWVGYSGFVGEFSFAMAAIFTAFVEAISTNCDNLILPLVMMLFLQIF